MGQLLSEVVLYVVCRMFFGDGKGARLSPRSVITLKDLSLFLACSLSSSGNSPLEILSAAAKPEG